MSILEKQVDALMRLCIAETDSEKAAAKHEVMQMMGARPANPAATDPEFVIQDLLLELGSPDHLVGYPYVVKAVMMVMEDRAFIDNIMFSLYPQLAEIFDTTPTRAERAIRHLIEVTWSRSDMKVLSRYFGNTVSLRKGKPTNSEFLARIANIAKLRMKEAA